MTQVPTSPRTIIVSLLILAALYGVYRSGLIHRWTEQLLGPQKNEYAISTADRLLSTPECARYRAAILAHISEPESSLRVSDQIAQAFRDGEAAGCKKRGIYD